MYVKIFGVLSFRNFNLPEPWAVDTLTVSNFRLSINRLFGFSRCRIFGLCFPLRFRGLYFSVLEIFLFQLYCIINYYFRTLSFLFLIHRWIKIYMNLESSLKKLKLKPFWLFFIRSFNPAPRKLSDNFFLVFYCWDPKHLFLPSKSDEPISRKSTFSIFLLNCITPITIICQI